MIEQNVNRLLKELPPGVQLVAAVKGVPPAAVLEAINAGVKIIGESYLQEAEKTYRMVGKQVEWHFIGHLQKNKVKQAVKLFDMIETVDSVELAREIDKRCAQIGKVMPVLIEVNSGREEQKSGVLPEDVEPLVREILSYQNIRVVGLMTMGPRSDNSEELKPYFEETQETFERIKQLNLPGVEMKYLSMGMTDSYRIAVEQGANIVRIGTGIFEKRESSKGQ